MRTKLLVTAVFLRCHPLKVGHQIIEFVKIKVGKRWYVLLPSGVGEKYSALPGDEQVGRNNACGF